MTAATSWHLVSGEYPPHGGGVGEYTALVAGGLAAAGQGVHVWAPAPAPLHAPFAVHPVEAFHGAGLRRLDAELDAVPGSRILLIQYAPQAFGRRGMNVRFCRWVLSRARRGDQVRVMFHEPFVRFGVRRPQRNVLAAATRIMARLLLRAASVAYVSTPAWQPLLQPLAPRTLGPLLWLPIPSTVPRVDDPAAVAMLRDQLGAGALVGHFGTYGGLIAPLLESPLAGVLSGSPGSSALLLGRGGPAFAARLARERPELAGRLHAPGDLRRDALSIHLQACDVMLQPYPDGVSARRTTVMAPLANGVAVVTNAGVHTEPVWRDGGVRLADDADGLGAAALALLGDAERRRLLADGAPVFYERWFGLPRTIRTLLEAR